MMKNNSEKIIVGMSGGVDSTVALLLLKEQGFSPIGVSLKLPVWQGDKKACRENSCCTDKALKTAQKICHKQNVPHYIYDVSADFEKTVVDYYIKEVKKNRTPNPCIVCNRVFKFKKLFDFAKKHGAKFIATGHYAKIKYNTKTEKYELYKPVDTSKDQTYYLSSLPQRYLSKIKFPLADLTKSQVYKIAKDAGFDFYTKTKQSQDFCYLNSADIPKFLDKVVGNVAGDIVDLKNNFLGKHSGLANYTLGQRKGLDLAGGPWFVIKKNKLKNQIIVSRDEAGIFTKEATIKNLNFVSGETIDKPTRVEAKIRYRQSLESATLFPISKTKFKLKFNQPVRAITPGQFAVFYKKDKCLGEGVIE